MKHVVLSMLMAALVAFGVVKIMGGSSTGTALASSQETAYERVMRTGVLRCGYVVFDPIIRKDEVSKKLSGIAVRTIEKVGKNANLKVEWTEEVNFADAIPGLSYNRYDAMCYPLWPNAAKAREAEFIVPTFFAALGVWVRPEDTRFDENLNAMNNEKVTISGVDGQIEDAIRQQFFPKAKILSLPAGTDYALSLLNVATKKADVTFVDFAAGALYNRSHADNPLKNVAAQQPFQIFPFSFAVKAGELRLKNLLDIAMQELIYTGEAAQIVDEELAVSGYAPGTFMHPDKGYEHATHP